MAAPRKPARLIAWDFDGVLNRNIRDGRFIWSRRFDTDLGLPFREFEAYLFGSGRFNEALLGLRDIAEIVTDWLAGQNTGLKAEDVLDYWFEHDTHPCAEMREMIEKSPLPSIIATNNEWRKAAHIRDELGYGDLVQKLFAAGSMGAMKPDAAFWQQIEDWAACAPTEILLVDDLASNIEAAEARGWQAVHLTDETRADLPDRLRAAGAL